MVNYRRLNAEFVLSKVLPLVPDKQCQLNIAKVFAENERYFSTQNRQIKELKK